MKKELVEMVNAYHRDLCGVDIPPYCTMTTTVSKEKIIERAKWHLRNGTACKYGDGQAVMDKLGEIKSSLMDNSPALCIGKDVDLTNPEVSTWLLVECKDGYVAFLISARPKTGYWRIQSAWVERKASMAA